jgi:hypothetical protein
LEADLSLLEALEGECSNSLFCDAVMTGLGQNENAPLLRLMSAFAADIGRFCERERPRHFASARCIMACRPRRFSYVSAFCAANRRMLAARFRRPPAVCGRILPARDAWADAGYGFPIVPITFCPLPDGAISMEIIFRPARDCACSDDKRRAESKLGIELFGFFDRFLRNQFFLLADS